MSLRKLGKHLGRFRQFLSSQDGSLRQKTIRSTIWVMFSTIGLSSLSLVKSIILARLLTPEHFGLMASCMVVIRAIEVFTETGLGAALIQRRGAVEEAIPTVYTIAALRGLVLSVLVVGMSPFIARFYEQPELTNLLQVLAVGMLLGGLGNARSVIAQKELDFRPLFYLQQAVLLIDFAVTILLAFLWRDVWALVVGNVTKTFVAVPLSFVFLPGRPHFSWNTTLARELLAYGKYITGLTIVVYVTTEIDNVVIGKVLGMEALGVYVVAYMLANLPATHIGKTIAGVMFSAYSKLQDDRPALQTAYFNTAQLVATVAVPPAVGLAVLANELISTVYGPKWIAAAQLLPILCAFGALRALTSVNGYIFNAIGKPNIPFHINLTKLILIAVTIVPATREFGLAGAAIAVTAPSALMAGVSYIVFSRVLNVPPGRIFAAILPAVIASGAMGFALLIAKRWVAFGTPLGLLLAIGGGAALYAVFNWTGIKRSFEIISRR